MVVIEGGKQTERKCDGAAFDKAFGTKRSPVSEGPFGDRKTKTVLLVDAEGLSQKLLTKLITDYGHKAKSVSSWENAVDAHMEDDIDLTIVTRSGGYGLKVVEEVKAVDPDAKIIMITGGGIETAEDRKLEGLGVIEIMESPRPGVLREAIEDCFDNGKSPGRRTFRGRGMRKGTIIAVDDEERVVKAVARQQKRMGHTVITTQDPEEVIRLYKTMRVDIVISDFEMKNKMDGLGLLKALKRYDPSAKVIIYAGGLEEREKRELINAGAAGIVDKGYVEDLKDLVTVYMRINGS